MPDSEPPTVEVPSGRPVKFLDDPTDFLLTSGLLFEINRRILHPYGLALSVTVDSETDKPTTAFAVQIWDNTDDPEGISFEEETFKAGLAKFQAFKRTQLRRLCHRLIGLGFIVQGDD